VRFLRLNLLNSVTVFRRLRLPHPWPTCLLSPHLILLRDNYIFQEISILLSFFSLSPTLHKTTTHDPPPQATTMNDSLATSGRDSFDLDIPNEPPATSAECQRRIKVLEAMCVLLEAKVTSVFPNIHRALLTRHDRAESWRRPKTRIARKRSPKPPSSMTPSSLSWLRVPRSSLSTIVTLLATTLLSRMPTLCRSRTASILRTRSP
jgi:hypothetical protein